MSSKSGTTISQENVDGHYQSNDLEKGSLKPSFLSTFKRKWKLLLVILLTTIIILAISLGVGLGVGLRNKNSSNGDNENDSSASANTSTRTNSTNSTLWRPAVSTSWQIELGHPITNTSIPVPVYDIDLFENNASTITSLHSRQKKVICYFSAGSFEDWRPDAGLFNRSADLGKNLQGWKGERWLDTRSANVRSIMRSRLDTAKAKGCDGLDPDNIDAYDNENGIGLSEDDAVDYLNFLAQEGHTRGMSVGLKNGGDVVERVVGELEWVVVEQCVKYKECGLYTPFVEQSKAVLSIEYPDKAPDIAASDVASKCPAKKGFSGVLKKMDLDDWVVECPSL